MLLYREDWKKRFGKYPESSDPLVVPARIHSYETIRKLSSAGVAGRVRNLLARSGLKGINVQADNGFRKFFNTMCRRAKVFEEDREDMMGHYEGLQKHYERYIEEDFERFPEYQKSIPLLTISDEQRALAEITLKNEIISELEKNSFTIENLETTVQKLMKNTTKKSSDTTIEVVLRVLKEKNLIS